MNISERREVVKNSRLVHKVAGDSHLIEGWDVGEEGAGLAASVSQR